MYQYILIINDYIFFILITKLLCNEQFLLIISIDYLDLLMKIIKLFQDIITFFHIAVIYHNKLIC
jgi:hypothetical protein